MAKTIKAARVPNEMVDKVEASCKRMAEIRGMEPTFSVWMVEAIAEKLKREEKMLKK